MLRAIVFDFDGVIANSEPLHYRAFRDVLREWRVDLREPDYYERYLGYDDVSAFRHIAADRGIEWDEERIADLVVAKAAMMERLEADGSILFPGAEGAVRQAAAALPLAIASGALGAEIRRVLDRAGLTPCFQTIVGAEDAARSKPAPDPYQKAVALLGLSAGSAAGLLAAECVAIEDSPWGLQSARAAGLRTVAVAQTYARDALDADLVIASIGDLEVAALERLCGSR